MRRHGFRYGHGRSEGPLPPSPMPGAGPDGTRLVARAGLLEGEVVSAGPVHTAVRPAPVPSVAGTIGRSAAVVVLALAIFLGLLIFCVIQ